jgi:hypothetical protein
MKLSMLAAAGFLIMNAIILPGSAANFAEDRDFLKQHTEVIVLSDAAGKAKIVLAPAWQGRVVTSTATGDAGFSFGFINRELVASGKVQAHMNPFGGEDRFWLGPEGGQFSIFFAKGAAFDLDHWFTPAAIDTMPYAVVGKTPESVEFAAELALTNYSGTRFDLKINRQVRLLAPAAALKLLGVPTSLAGGDIHLVAYESDNKITNTGKQPWKKDTGLLSIWILGMFKPSAGTTIVVPFRAGAEGQLGPAVTSDYFGKVPPERLQVRGDAIFFSGDGKFRSKIGVNPRRSKAVLGSYDADNKVLTIVQFSQPEGVMDYVNSLWKIQDNPYGGDALNSYNDGPPSPGAKPLGPFCEMETSSPAAALAPGKSLSHVHRTLHLSGSEEALNRVALATLGVSLKDIQSALKR